jgi:hypothetical protein
VNDQEFARFQRQGEAIKAHLESRSDSAKREAARHGPRAAELADLENRLKLAESRLHSITRFAIDESRTLLPGEGAAFDETTLEIGRLQRKIREIVGA